MILLKQFPNKIYMWPLFLKRIFTACKANYEQYVYSRKLYGELIPYSWSSREISHLAGHCPFSCVFNQGVKSSGKAVYLTATVPYAMLFLLFIRLTTIGISQWERQYILTATVSYAMLFLLFIRLTTIGLSQGERQYTWQPLSPTPCSSYFLSGWYNAKHKYLYLYID